jgi:hypothetical protein
VDPKRPTGETASDEAAKFITRFTILESDNGRTHQEIIQTFNEIFYKLTRNQSATEEFQLIATDAIRTNPGLEKDITEYVGQLYDDVRAFAVQRKQYKTKVKAAATKTPASSSVTTVVGSFFGTNPTSFPKLQGLLSKKTEEIEPEPELELIFEEPEDYPTPPDTTKKTPVTAPIFTPMDTTQFNDLLTRLAGLTTALTENKPSGVKESNIVKIAPFHGENDDPISWIEDFEAAANANGWTSARRLQVVPAYLKGAAAQWLQQRKSNDDTMPAEWTTTTDHTDEATTF